MCLWPYRTCLTLRTYILVVLFWDLHLSRYQCLFWGYYIYSDLYFLYRTRQLNITNVLFWRSVEMYISIDMYHDRKENKNVGTSGFVQLYIISQHRLWHFKKHDLSTMLHSCPCTTRSTVVVRIFIDTQKQDSDPPLYPLKAHEETDYQSVQCTSSTKKSRQNSSYKIQPITKKKGRAFLPKRGIIVLVRSLVRGRE